MSNFHHFLVEHAMFPSPVTDETKSRGTTEISKLDVGNLETKWKATHAMKDDSLIPKLCHALQDILGDMELSAVAENHLRGLFSPQLELHKATGTTEDRWLENPNETHSRLLLDIGFFNAVLYILGLYGNHKFNTVVEHAAKGSASKVDYLALVDGRKTVLLEAKSPSVMAALGKRLPDHSFELDWEGRSTSIVRKILGKSALYMGLRNMEWLFLSSHNHWVVCRLVSDSKNPFLAFSSMLNIKDSSVPFRALLGAILSVTNGVPVSTRTFDPQTAVLDPIPEEDSDDSGPLPENDLDDGSGAYSGGSSRFRTRTRAFLDRLSKTLGKRTQDKGNESGLMITTSSKKLSESFQVWIHLHTSRNNTLSLPQFCESRNPRLWLTEFVGSGSTGIVWKCCFDNRDELFAIKIAEPLRRSEAASRERLRNEFKAYLVLEEAYQSGNLPNRIAPQCYGAFEDDTMDVLLLELCDGILHGWNELSDSECVQVYNLVVDLHRIGIVHRDLEPRNVARVHGGGFRLIDFTESGKHRCKEIKAADPVQKPKCYELQTLRQLLQRPL